MRDPASIRSGRRRSAGVLVAALAASLLLAAPISAAPVTVAAAGDIARPEPKPPQQATADVITDVIDPDRVLMLGDAQYRQGEYLRFLQSYDPTWGVFLARTEPIPGNHEYEKHADARGFYRYFKTRLARHGSVAQDPAQGWYAFDLGRWHVVALNTNCAFGVDCSAQKRWLRQELRSDPHRCQLVIGHHGRKSYIRLAAEEKADLYLNGHKHTYERWDRALGTRIRQFVVGSGGFSIGAPRPGANFGLQEYGVLELKLRAGGYTWRFIDQFGAVRDSGTGSCRN